MVSLKQAAQWAAGFDVRLALEFRGSATFCASLDTALALVAQCGEPNVGVNFDVFHYYTGPSKFEDLGLLTPRQPGLRAGLRPGRRAARAGHRRRPHPARRGRFPARADRASSCGPIGYDGWVSLELMNPTLWKAKAAQVAELGIAALRPAAAEPGR